jgi:curli biogenesis system outer membrane secretion channel CsgG
MRCILRTKLVASSILALLLVLPAHASAQAKIKVAIWEFENHAETSWWFFRDMGPAARNQIDTEFSENKTLSDKFSVVERDKLALVLKEQGLATSGAVDPASAAKVGKILGVKYIILGGIDKFNIDNTKGAIGKFGVGGNLRQANATINLRFIDSTTAERVISISADGETKKGGGFALGASGSKDSEWGLASETIQKTAKAVVAKLTSGDYLARVSNAAAPAGGVVEGKIIRVDGTKAYINMGSASGLKVGDKFNVFDPGEALVDPDTGAKLGSTEKQVGTATVAEVQEKFAILQATGTVTTKYTVRKQ